MSHESKRLEVEKQDACAGRKSLHIGDIGYFDENKSRKALFYLRSPAHGPARRNFHYTTSQQVCQVICAKKNTQKKSQNLCNITIAIRCQSAIIDNVRRPWTEPSKPQKTGKRAGLAKKKKNKKVLDK